MKFERFIARRYLFSGRNKASFSAITVISILGVALGVFALVVVTAVMDGFDANLEEKFIGANAHITVERAWAEAPPLDAEKLIPQIAALPEVKGAAPAIQQLAMLMVQDQNTSQPRQAGILLHGVDLEREPQVTDLMKKVTGKRLPDRGEIVLGKPVLNQQLFVPLGTRMLMIFGRFGNTPDGETVARRNMTVVGTFETGFPQTDEMVGYTTIDHVRRIFGLPPGHVDGIRVRVKNLKQIDAVKAEIQKMVGADFRVKSWIEDQQVLFNALRLEKWAMFIILLLIVLVAAFNIVGILTMIVLEKTREIGILKSMGAREGSILRVFLNQGLAIGGAGIVLGGGGGLLTCYVLDRYVRIPELTGPYLSDKIPILVEPWTVGLIFVASIVIVLIASLLPARQAARLDPVEALRYE